MNGLGGEHAGRVVITHLAAEGAGVSRMLRDLHFLHLLTQGGTVALYNTLEFNTPSWTLGETIPTVPYFPVTPTLRVRFVCGRKQVNTSHPAGFLAHHFIEM